jgi:hypothetical protein
MDRGGGRASNSFVSEMVAENTSYMYLHYNLSYCGGNRDGLKSGRRNTISSPVLACKIRKDY